MSKMTVKQGESTDIFTITIEFLADYTDYYGDLTVLNADTEAVVLGPIRVNPTNNKFSVALSHTQTAALPVDNYTVVFVVSKEVATVIEFRKEISCPLKITKSLITS